MNPSQRQIIPLQARPYEQDEVTGTLTVEVNFFFYLLFITKKKKKRFCYKLEDYY